MPPAQQFELLASTPVSDPAVIDFVDLTKDLIPILGVNDFRKSLKILYLYSHQEQRLLDIIRLEAVRQIEMSYVFLSYEHIKTRLGRASPYFHNLKRALLNPQDQPASTMITTQ